MKTFLTACTLLIFLAITNAQVTDTSGFKSTTSLYQEYLQKSKKKKTVGWIMLGGGTALAAASLPLVEISALGGSISDRGMVGGLMLVAGIATSVSSIYYFRRSRQYKRKALQIGVKSETLRMNNKTLPKTIYPALSVNIPLGKQ